MDQATGTADLTETEKFLLSSSTKATVDSTDSSDIDDDEEVESAQDALLGGIRSGLSVMTKTAKNSLSTCKNRMELDDAIDKIQASSLKLLKLEKSFLKTASIVSDVVDDMVSDFDEEEDDDQPAQVSGIGSGEGKGAGDAEISIMTSKQQPYIFQPSQRNVVSLERFTEKLKKEYHKRMDEYKDSLTDDYLKQDMKFETLLKQIRLGKNEAEATINFAEGQKKKLGVVGQLKTDDDDDATDNSSFLSSLPYSEEELRKHKYRPYDEDEEMDDSVLPFVDPISRKLIMHPVKNKFCNHVFDRASIFAYITGNADAKCPVHMCRNNRALERSHFVSDTVLTAHIRRKNNF